MRKDAEDYVYKIMDKLDPTGINKELYKKRFKDMSDKEFGIFMDEISRGENSLMVNVSGDVKLSHDRNIKTLKEMGKSLFKKVIITRDGKKIKPNIDYLVLTLPYRRAAQHIKKNYAVHKNLKQRNTNTGQVTGNSKAGSLSAPEAHLLSAMHLDNTAKELLGTRGGDINASNAFASLLFKQGKVSNNELDIYRSRTGGALYIKALFKAKHINLNT